MRRTSIFFAALAFSTTLLTGAASHGQRPRPGRDRVPEPAPPPLGQAGPVAPPMPPPPSIDDEELPERDDFSERFPSREGGQRKREARATRVASQPAAPTSERPEALCSGLPAESRLNCPLRPGVGKLLAIEEMPSGARLRYARGSIEPSLVQQTLDCQAALSAVRPAGPGPICSFLSGATRVAFSDTGAGTAIEISVPNEDAASALRSQLRTVFGRTRGPGRNSGVRAAERAR